VKSRAWLAAAAVVVAVPGVLRDVSVIFWKQGRLATSRIDDRFAGIEGRLPPDETIGFLTDTSGEEVGRRYFHALYALAPHLILEGASARYVLADLAEPMQMTALCERWRLHVVVRGAPGVALLERD